MKTVRVAAILGLGAVVGAVLTYFVFLWCRGPQPVMRVDQVFTVNEGTSVLKEGQILKWVGADANTGFSIMWIGDSPCEPGTNLSSHLVDKVPTVTCKIMKNIRARQIYSYEIGPFSGKRTGGGGNPCYGCTFEADPGNSSEIKLPYLGEPALSKNLDAGQPGLVVVSCSGGVSLSPDPIAAYSLGNIAEVTWGQGTGATLSAAPTFDKPTQGSCVQTSVGWACPFPTDPTTYPVHYTETATGASCGTGTVSGTINAPN